MSDSLKMELKELIVATVQLPDLEADRIPDDEALFGEGLDLDSIDALELVMQLEKAYGIKISSSEESRVALSSVNALTDYINEHGTKRPQR